MSPDMTHEEEHLRKLKHRCMELRNLASRLSMDKRGLRATLPPDDSLIVAAKGGQVPLACPLTIGTMLASVLAEQDSVECAIRCSERRLHPKALQRHHATPF